ncbi:hypothetical protein BHE74_00035146 [Ensete ventricosum]|nr:hypothetical protein BHE74_00035146 [Ensete ventricosum]
MSARLGTRARQGEARTPRFYSKQGASKRHRLGARPSPGVVSAEGERRKGRTWGSSVAFPISILAHRLLGASWGESSTIAGRRKQRSISRGGKKKREKKRENLGIQHCSSDLDPHPRSSRRFAGRIFGDCEEKKTTFSSLYVGFSPRLRGETSFHRVGFSGRRCSFSLCE